MEQQDKDQSLPSNDFPKVILSVSGGVADIIFKPQGLEIVIYDYDTDGVAETQKDPDGENCIISEWPASEKVINNPHWPIIQQAKPNITCRCQRKWQCPNCDHIIELSYEEIIEVGTPYCPQCETEMILI